MTNIERDRELIAKLGGCTKVSEMLGYPKAGGPQRVQNWLGRGIPSHVRVKYPRLFMPELVQNPSSEWDGVERRDVTQQLTDPVAGRREIDRADGFPAIEPA